MDADRSPLLLTNLLNDLETLCRLLVERIAVGDGLNSYLLAAGAQQIVEDYLHRDPLSLSRGAARLERLRPGRGGHFAAAIPRTGGRLIWRASAARPGDRSAARWRSDLATLVDDLAHLSLNLAGRVGRGSPEARATHLATRLQSLPPALRRQVVRLPACFRSFDQAPEDMETLARRFAAGWPRLEQPLTVVGVRSSGSYLAPLLTARLRREGYLDVLSTTIRPGQPWLKEEARTLRNRARRSSLALVVDDPPLSWGSIGDSARDLVKLGFEPEEVVLLVPALPATAERPVALARHPLLLLPWQDWAMCQRLEPEAVGRTLSELFEGREVVTQVRPASPQSGPVGRGHASAVFDVTLRQDSSERRLAVRGRGVGAGYFGAHALAVAARLQDWLPEIHGLRAGVLYEAWSPPERRLRTPLTEEQVEAVAGYVAERSRAIPTEEDPGAGVLFRGAAWLAGSALSRLFGPAPEMGRPLAAAVVRRILGVEAPAIIDGHCELDRFAVSEESGRMLKTDFDSGVFTSADLFCFDPVFDLAQAAASSGEQIVGERLRRRYEEATDRQIDPERWLLYQLLAINEMESERPPEESQTASRLAPLVQRYYGEVLLGGLTAKASGPLCAIEVDGCLETTPLGFPATSPLGAMALRSLICHGFRPLLMTGRSVSELQDRCRAYGVAGGVAEHGAVTYDRRSDSITVLVGDEEGRALERLRSVLGRLDGVRLEGNHCFSIRACHFDGGQSRPLDSAVAQRALTAASATDLLRPIHGSQQTDFVAPRVDREMAVRMLAQDLGVSRRDRRPLSFVVGGDTPDLGVCRLAREAYWPAVKGAAVQTPAVQRLRASGQRGLAAAVADVLGHQAGRCPLCGPPAFTMRAQLLLELLRLQEAHGWQKARRSLAILPLSVRKRSKQ